jgi:HK97 gp10 family phage protein
MIEMKAEPSNEKAIKSVDEIAKRTHEGIRQGFFKLGKDLREEAKRLITEPPKTGRIYRVRIGGKIVLHQASAAGEAPANMTGALKSTVGYDVSGANQITFGAGNKDKVKYAGYLENGTKKMAKRPYLKPAIEKSKARAFEHLKTEIEYRLVE